MKKCKGLHKLTYGLGCGLPVKKETRKYGLCRSCFKEWLKTEKGQEYINKNIIPKAKKKVEKENKKKKKAEKEKLINYRSKLQSKLQEIARLIDIGLPCLARGYHANQIQGGHVFAKGGNSSMALNLHNIHRQSAQSNKWQNDDGLLREGLIKEYGNDYFTFISELRRTPQLHYTHNEYKDFYKKACTISNELKRAGKRYLKAERIELRNTINSQLGIYLKEFCIFELKINKNEITKAIN